ncbi:hypothetical protein MFIFM68171_09679 [Madurella fahalii]|uniref:NadR/Ttd14 AAA domain-containing protein n=1 Tax=Madurella fahalii TaxID=1157608 RepID=A0ABQ0GP03_9PEZI
MATPNPELRETQTLPPNIYIIGAQCTGKTTLVNNLREHFSTHPHPHPNSNPDQPGQTGTPPPVIISELARSVIKAHDFTTRDVRSPTRSLALQQLILAAQAAAERDAVSQGRWFISDRSGADPIAYALRYVGEVTTRRVLCGSDEWRELKGRMQRSLVVVCEAGAEAAGWLTDDGVRLMPEDLDEWVGFHGTFCGFLEGEGVRFEVLPAGVTGREERVGFVLDRWKGLR